MARPVSRATNSEQARNPLEEAISGVRRWGRMPLRTKDISDWIKIVVLIVPAIFGYQHLVDVVAQQAKSLAIVEQRAERIERYLSSQDPQYWQKAQQMGEGQPFPQ
jgi:hypothetical protein